MDDDRHFGARKSVTITDVARAAGLSKSSVSRAINSVPGSVSAANARRVQQAIDELGYVPNAVASHLARSKTTTIGYVLPDIGNPFFSLVVSGIEAALNQTGHTLLIASSDGDHQRERELTQSFLERRVDGLLVTPADPRLDHLMAVVERGIQVVLVDVHVPRTPFDCVAGDGASGAALACRYLLQLGHTEIGVIAGQRRALEGRLASVRRTLRDAATPLAPHRCVFGGFSLAGGYQGATALLQSHAPPTALFVLNNLMTVGAMLAISDLGLSIPTDVSLVGFDDMDWYPIADPPITAVAQPALEIGERAVDVLLTRISGRQGPPQRVVLPTELIERASASRVSAAVEAYPEDGNLEGL